MKILYHLTSPAPIFPDSDAVYQEAGCLQKECRGEFINLYPFNNPVRYFPRGLYGVHCLDRITRLDRAVDLHHVYFTDLTFFPALWMIKKPIVYSVVSRVQARRRPKVPRNIHIVVNNERDRDRLESWGMANYTFIRPGIDISRIVPSYRPVDGEFTLLAGSAPWVKSHIRQKGFEALLDVVGRMPRIRLVCLWRGVLYNEIMEMIKDRGIEDQVTVINEKADVNEILQGVHAAVVLSDEPGIVKAYPHSLMEALAAGKPVILNDVIPMSDYVERNRCGRCIGAVSAAAIAEAVEAVIAGYDSLRRNALSVGRRDFSRLSMVASYRRLYETAIKRPRLICA